MPPDAALEEVPAALRNDLALTVTACELAGVLTLESLLSLSVVFAARVHAHAW
jgi:hypothetical protein